MHTCIKSTLSQTVQQKEISNPLIAASSALHSVFELHNKCVINLW